jgi:elongation factor G
MGIKSQYAHVFLRLEPQERGVGYQFVNGVEAGILSNSYVLAIDMGIQDQLRSGTLSGYPVLDIKATLLDGSYHDVDSSDSAFRTAASMCFREGTRIANPVLLEPVMRVEITTPEECMGHVISDISRRRGVIHAMKDTVSAKIIDCELPLSEMFGYATDLRSATKGRATYSMQFGKYGEVPVHITEAIIKKFS